MSKKKKLSDSHRKAISEAMKSRYEWLAQRRDYWDEFYKAGVEEDAATRQFDLGEYLFT